MAKAKQRTKAKLRAKLARNVAAILSNPETPAKLYNDLADSLCDMFNDLTSEFYYSPDIIERTIDARRMEEEARKAGER
jgi:hypothetical protein